MGILAIVTLVSAGAGVYMLSKALPNFQPGSKRIQADLKALKGEVDQLNTELVPVDLEEIELFSHDQIKNSVRKNVGVKAKGVFTTIYHEPVLAYGMRRYISGKNKNAIMYARTAKHEFSYRYHKGEVQFGIDGKLVGTIRENGILYGGKSKRRLANINRENSVSMPVIIGDREVASMTSFRLPTKKEKNLGKRAFEFVKNDISQEEILLLLGLALHDFLNVIDA